MDCGEAWLVTIHMRRIVYRYRNEATTLRHYRHYGYRANRHLRVGGGQIQRHTGTNPSDCN